MALLLACAPNPQLDRDLWAVPKHFPDAILTDPITPEQVALGRHLFFDFGLSDTGTRSCAVCHETAKAFTDGFVRAVGTQNDIHPHNTLSVANVAWRDELGWVPGGGLSLEDQLRIPLLGEHPVEMGMSEDMLLERLNDNPVYGPLFEAATGTPEPTLDAVLEALASYQRTLISGQSPYDAYLQGAPLSSDAERGRALFFGERMKCGHCHGGVFLDRPTTPSGWLGAPSGAYNTGLYNVDGQGAYPESAPGLVARSGRAQDQGVFRTPSLRNVALTGPWGHDGSVASLSDMLNHYARGGREVRSGANAGDGADNPYKSRLIQGFSMSERERSDLLAFLEALSDPTLVDDPHHQSPFCPFDGPDTGDPDCLPDSRPTEDHP